MYLQRENLETQGFTVLMIELREMKERMRLHSPILSVSLGSKYDDKWTIYKIINILLVLRKIPRKWL